jgi:signal transduction histidine kinase
MRWLHPIVWPLLLVICSFLFINIYSDRFIRVKNIEYLYDRDGAYDINTIQSALFARSNNNTIPPSSKIIWLKLKTQEAHIPWPDGAILFTGSNETALSMHGYIVSSGQIKDLGECNVLLNAPDCWLTTLQYAFPISPENLKGTAEIYLKVVSDNSGINSEFYYMNRTYFNKVTIFIVHFIGMSTGIFLLVTIFSGIFYISLRETCYLIYGLFYFSLFFSVLVNRGIWDAFKPDYIHFSGATLMQPSLLLIFFFDLLFLVFFFEMYKKSKFLYNIYLLFLSVIIIMVVLTMTSFAKVFAWQVFGFLIFSSTGLAAITLFIFIWQRRKWAEYVAAAWGVAIVCNLIWASYRANLIEGYWFFGYYGIFGRVLETIILKSVILQKLKNLNFSVGFLKAKTEEGVVVKTLLRTLSHDLANTTQLIQTGAEIIKENPSPESVQRNLKYILNATKSQSEIIENAKGNFLVRGGQLVSLMPVDLKQCIKEILAIFKSRLEQKKLSIDISFPDETLLIFAERTSLVYQVLTNVISNAIKFSHVNNSISIKAISEPAYVELIISDHGVGIPGYILDRLFDELESISRPGTMGETGTGQGLIIAKDFVTSYGGNFKIDSQVGKGTTVTLRFKKYI